MESKEFLRYTIREKDVFLLINLRRAPSSKQTILWVLNPSSGEIQKKTLANTRSIFDAVKQICLNSGNNDVIVSDAGSSYYVTSMMFSKIKNQKSDAVYRTLITVDGKTGRRRVVCQPYATKMFEDWKKICAEFGVSTNQKDLVFRHPPFSNHGAEKIDQPIETTNVAFKGVLDKLNLGTDADGRQRTVYSIRHSIISHLLADGVNLNAISKNAGVSIETMTRAYDHTESVDYINEITKADKTKFDEFYEPQKSA